MATSIVNWHYYIGCAEIAVLTFQREIASLSTLCFEMVQMTYFLSRNPRSKEAE